MLGEVSLDGNAPGLWMESLPDGWLWAIRGACNQWTISLFVDPSSLGEGIKQLWGRMLGESRLADRFIVPPQLVKTIEVTPVAASCVFAQGMLHIGDSALARDPLASQGLTAALSDGQSAAIAIHTLVLDPTKEDIVSRFLENRLSQAKQRHLKFLSESYADSPYDTAFWSKRREPTFASPSPVDPIHIGRDRPLAISSVWCWRDCPVLESESIRLAQCLCSESESIRWLAGRPIRDFLSALTTTSTAEDLVQHWVGSKMASPQSARQVLGWLLDRRVLVQAESPLQSRAVQARVMPTTLVLAHPPADKTRSLAIPQ